MKIKKINNANCKLFCKELAGMTLEINFKMHVYLRTAPVFGYPTSNTNKVVHTIILPLFSPNFQVFFPVTDSFDLQEDT